MKKAAVMSLIGCMLLAGCGTSLVQPVPVATNEMRPVTADRPHPLNPPEPPVNSVTPQNQVMPDAEPTVTVKPVKPVVGTATKPKQNPAPPTPSVQITNWGHLPPFRDKGKNVVLTFDDGPSPYTSQLIQTLDSNQVPAIFFWNTYHIQYANAKVRSLLADSPDIGIGDHTVDHPNMVHLGYDAQFKEIVDAQHTIEQTVGKPVVFYRPPYGNYNSVTQSVLNVAKLTPVLWNDDSLDWKYNSNESALLNEIKRELQPGAVILMHDHPYTIKFLPDIISMIRREGYGFTTLATP